MLEISRIPFVLICLICALTGLATADITTPDDEVRGVPNDGDWPFVETPPLAIDDNIDTKYLHFKGAIQATGFQVTPAAGPSIVIGLTFTTANDSPERDPVAFELYGSNKSIDGPYTLIAGGEISDFNQAEEWPRFTINQTPITFDNDVTYNHYQLLFTAVRDPARANSMQIAEVEFLADEPNDLPPVNDDDGDDDDDDDDPTTVVDGPNAQINDSALIISEFMTSNETTISTRVGGKTVFPDWIELFNSQTEPIDLTGWYLTDTPEDLTKWALPSIQLEPGSCLLLFASGVREQDHPTNWPYRDDTGYYHINFKLDRNGEYLALITPDLKVAHQYGSANDGGYPLLETDTSYGVYGNQEQYYTEPSPGQVNGPGYGGISAEPIFSHDTGTYLGYIFLEIDSTNPDAEIRYTLDGRVPDETSSGRYTGNILLMGNTEVIARVYEPGKAPSAPVIKTYMFLSSDMSNFSSNLPIVLIDTQRTNINSSSYRRVHAAFIDVDEDGQANALDPVDFAGRGALKIRGSSTSGAPKRQYNFEVWDEHDRDKDVSLLGFPAESDWVLYAPLIYDRALINNALAYEVSNQVGRYAVRTRFCEMYLSYDDTFSASDYVGLYIFMEKIKRGPDRVDVEELDPDVDHEPALAGGYMLKIDRPDPGDSGFRTSRGNPTYGDGTLCYVDPKEDEITSVQSAWIRGYLDDFEDALYGANFAHPQTGYAQYIDVESWIDHNLLNMLFMNVDALRLSTFIHKKRGGKLEMGPLWDFDRAMDSTDSRDNNPQSWHGTGDGTDYLNYVWWNRLFEDVNFWQKYIDRWYDLRNGGPFGTTQMNATIDAMADEIREAQERNYDRWSSYGPRYGSFQGEIDHLQDWLETRSTWIDNQFVAPPIITPNGGQIASPGTVEIVNPHDNGTIYYTLDGSDPRLPVFNSTVVEADTLLSEDATKYVLIPTGPVDDAWRQSNTFDDSDWIHGNGGVGYEQSMGYEPYFNIDVLDQMYGFNETCYIRIPFTFSGDTSKYNTMTLLMQFDDGFIAYLNGVEIARAQFFGAPTWNSGASGSHSDIDAIYYQEFDISTYTNLLQTGSNLLAIHGLNSGATSSDFLINAQLIASQSTDPSEGGLAETALEYTGPIALEQSTQIKARVVVNSNPYSPWSGLAQPTFSVGPVAENLRISEIMYHPADLGRPDDPNTEYIELTNIGTETLNLNLVTFTNGVDFTFGPVELAPGGYTLIVRNIAAFESKYGVGLPIAGQYAGSLSNGGEKIELQDAAGTIIHEFSYEDNWYDTTDGSGFSLTVKNPATVDPNALGDKASWRPSAYVDGSPGFDDSGDVLELGAVVINEVMANPDTGQPDWIELYNTTDQTIDLSG